MALALSPLVLRNRITEHCSLRDVFNGNIMIMFLNDATVTSSLWNSVS